MRGHIHRECVVYEQHRTCTRITYRGCSLREILLHDDEDNDDVSRKAMIKHKWKWNRRGKKQSKLPDYKMNPHKHTRTALSICSVLCSIIFHYPQRVHLFLCRNKMETVLRWNFSLLEIPVCVCVCVHCVCHLSIDSMPELLLIFNAQRRKKTTTSISKRC